jgi:nicotinate-nucleotide adenylyltransferase
MKIGVFGGTFNPPHKGHTRLVTEFCEKLRLDRVLIIPDKAPVHKSAEGLEPDTDRLKMCRLAFFDKRFEVSDIEIKRDTDSYTVYTLREIKKMYPDDDLYLIIGSDMFLMFSRWYEYREILSMCTLCVASRCEEESLDELRRYSENELKIPIDGLTGKGIIISPVEPFEISSTELRSLLKTGESTEKYLDGKVRKYIEDRGLYGYPKK